MVRYSDFSLDFGCTFLFICLQPRQSVTIPENIHNSGWTQNSIGLKLNVIEFDEIGNKTKHVCI